MTNLTMSMFLTKEDLEKARIAEVMDVLDGPEQECHPIDPLLDRGCAIFDGNCDCPAPALYTCKRYTAHMVR